jgi:hypothetical protein
MILILSAPDDSHVSLVTRKLAKIQADVRWIDPGSVPATAKVVLSYDSSHICRMNLLGDKWAIDLAGVSAVWYRRPSIATAASNLEDGLHSWMIEETNSCLVGLWQLMNCRWIPGRIYDQQKAENKIEQLARAAILGFSIPRTLITNDPAEFIDFYETCNGRLVTKTLHNSSFCRNGEMYGAYTRTVQRRDLANCDSVGLAPIIIQEYVPKRVELRITVVGSRVFAAEIDSQKARSTRHDWRHYDFSNTRHSSHALPHEIESLCINIVRSFDLCFGAIDMVLTPAGEYVFLEINPNGQWDWIESLTGLPISDEIVTLLTGDE